MFGCIASVTAAILDIGSCAIGCYQIGITLWPEPGFLTNSVYHIQWFYSSQICSNTNVVKIEWEIVLDEIGI